MAAHQFAGVIIRCGGSCGGVSPENTPVVRPRFSRKDISGFFALQVALAWQESMERILAKALGQDVSKLAGQEKQLLLSRLLARLAHEIRNPLSSLDIHVQLLEEDLAKALPEELHEKTTGRLEIIRGELHRLENVVKQFLSLAGPSSLELRRVELGRLIAHVCELLRPEAAMREVELQANVATDLPQVVADPGQLTQALVNLLINAIQAVERKGSVTVSAVMDAGNGVLSIKVQDSGPGLPREKESAMFEPFFTTKPEGSGLGLWIVQQIVVAHGGVIQAANAPEGGAVFTLHLPLSENGKAHG
jgi:signal transduction histidine kinase